MNGTPRLSHSCVGAPPPSEAFFVFVFEQSVSPADTVCPACDPIKSFPGNVCRVEEDAILSPPSDSVHAVAAHTDPHRVPGIFWYMRESPSSSASDAYKRNILTSRGLPTSSGGRNTDSLGPRTTWPKLPWTVSGWPARFYVIGSLSLWWDRCSDQYLAGKKCSMWSVCCWKLVYSLYLAWVRLIRLWVWSGAAHSWCMRAIMAPRMDQLSTHTLGREPLSWQHIPSARRITSPHLQ